MFSKNPALLELFDIVEQAGEELRFVGGSVRDFLLRREVSEIDLATTALPDKLSEILIQKNIRVIPTGRLFGTITVVHQGSSFEITTLRRDIETDGRHATTFFTRDWQEDSQRRDLTINGLYADKYGKIYDYVGGAADIKAGCLRFIGNPEDRVKEDFLRILRFFRFWANLEDFTPDPDSLEACVALSPSLGRLSGERIWSEIAKLLMASNALPVLEYMACKNIPIAKGFTWENITHFHSLATKEQHHRRMSDLRRLAVFCDHPKTLAQRLKLSRLYYRRLEALKNRSPLSFSALACHLYYTGAVITEDWLFFEEKFDEEERAQAIKQIIRWKKPKFPLGGEDWKKHGFISGPEIGKIQKRVEQWWVENNFPSRDKCLDALKRFA